MRYNERTYQYHVDGPRAKCGRLVATDMNHAMYQVAELLGYRHRIAWHADGTRMTTLHRGTRVVVYRLWACKGGLSEDGEPPDESRRLPACCKQKRRIRVRGARQPGMRRSAQMRCSD